MEALIVLILATYHLPKVTWEYRDNGVRSGCPAFYHSHEGDPRCFDNDDVPQVEHGPVLPVPRNQV